MDIVIVDDHHIIRSGSPSFFDISICLFKLLQKAFESHLAICGIDGWTIRTADGKPSAHFEHTIAIRKDKADILSSFDFIEAVLRERNLEII